MSIASSLGSFDCSPTRRSRNPRQSRYWMATIPHHGFTPYLPNGVDYIRGQLEIGESGTSYLHWQICIYFGRKVSRRKLQEYFGEYHYEPTRSKAALDYVWKEATCVDGTKFELGQLPIQRNCTEDWDRVWCLAVERKILEIPADIRIRCYSTIRRIGEDFMEPIGMERVCSVFWGRTGSGKSRRAWEEAGQQAYSKDPRTKFWCGYRNQECVVIDEFRGSIDVSHLLRWLDRYPVSVEIKGGAVPLSATRYWITSNLHPRQWYPELDNETVEALLRRLQIVMFE